MQNRVDDAGHAAGRGAKNNRNREALQNGARKRTLAKLLGEDMVSSSAGFRDPAKAV
ncbi:tail assembly chaperone [Mycobacterium phage PBI1]|uniref:Uncharacterized protein n=1 Tax=Mycobacterium phage PBI1 TaxID=373410 RepID=Q19ZE1_9CAUD|nr:tail assembly chaperone [Mycobacterium phage PBI1]ABD58442.1 hypothetical protein PBI_PBI1_26 [Mycobacterium phage PBI1]